MRFTSALLGAAMAMVAYAANEFTNTDFSGISVGSTFNITWNPTTPGPVTLTLMTGDPLHLDEFTTIASSVPNTGFYLWTPNSNIVKGSEYALRIADVADPTNPNYSVQFAVDSPNTSSVVKTTSVSTVATSSSTEVTTSTSTESETSTSTSASTSASTSTSTDSTDSTSATGSTSSRPTSTTRPTSSSTRQPSSTSTGAAATAKVGAGIVGFVGAAVMLI